METNKNGALSDGRVMWGECVHLEAEPRVWDGYGQPACLGVGVASRCVWVGVASRRVWDGRGQPCARGARLPLLGMFARGLLSNLPSLSSTPRGALGVCLLAVRMVQIFPKDKAET